MRYWNIWNGWKMCILPGYFIQFLFCFVFTVVIYVCILKKSLYSKYTYWHKYVICFKSPGRRMRSKCETLLAMLLLFSVSDIFATPWTVTRQTSLSTGHPRQEYWSGLSFPPPSHLPDPGIKLMSPALQVDSLPLNHLESPLLTICWFSLICVINTWEFLIL